MFSPITERSLKIRLLYMSIYLVLILGGLTMVFPFMIMITGSMESRADIQNSFFPKWLVNRDAMWNRFLNAKYRATADTFRGTWGDPEANLRENRLPELKPGETRLWDEFLEETKPAPHLFTLGFLRNPRMPSYPARLFRIWLLQEYGNDLERLNRELGTQFTSETAIVPPSYGLVGAFTLSSPLMAKFLEFSNTECPQWQFPWNVGNYYRGVLLPRILGADVAAYNKKYGTDYPSYEAIPFPETAPEAGLEDWMFYLTKVLNSDFVELTPSGLEAQKAAGVTKAEFIRAFAKPEHLRVLSVDILFARWAKEKKGIGDARIPQVQIDRVQFEAEESFWKWTLPTINYTRVIDEILLQGHAIKNTIILVVLSMAGALIINPLAAYALSRFKLRQTYFILLFFLATISFPAEVTMIPVFLQMREFNLLNTFGALVLPGLANGFSIFLLKGFFDSLPKDLYEAAELDGASEWMMFWQITMNLSKPILAVIALGAFATAYGAFFYALILAPDPKIWTIMVNIYQLRMYVDTPVVYASLILTAIPTLLVFIFCQNIILRGIVVPSDK